MAGEKYKPFRYPSKHHPTLFEFAAREANKDITSAETSGKGPNEVISQKQNSFP